MGNVQVVSAEIDDNDDDVSTYESLTQMDLDPISIEVLEDVGTAHVPDVDPFPLGIAKVPIKIDKARLDLCYIWECVSLGP